MVWWLPSIIWPAAASLSTATVIISGQLLLFCQGYFFHPRFYNPSTLKWAVYQYQWRRHHILVRGPEIESASTQFACTVGKLRFSIEQVRRRKEGCGTDRLFYWALKRLINGEPEWIWRNIVESFIFGVFILVETVSAVAATLMLYWSFVGHELVPICPSCKMMTMEPFM